MAWWHRRSRTDEVVGAFTPERGDRVIAWGVTDAGVRLVATVRELVALAPDARVLERHRWLEVDRGTWEGSTGTVSVTWVGSARGSQWTLGADAHRFAETFRDRVEASRVVDAPIVAGEETLGRAAIRKDLGTGELVPQLVFERQVRRDEDDVRTLGEVVLADLKEQVGI